MKLVEISVSGQSRFFSMRITQAIHTPARSCSGRAPVALQVTPICFCRTTKRDFGKIQYQQIGKYLGDEAKIAESQNRLPFR